MNRPLARLSLVILAAAAMTMVFIAVVAQARPTSPPILRYVAPPPTGSDAGNCTNPSSPCATVQYAIDQAYSGDEIRVAGGTYAPGGTVAVITKSLGLMEGGYRLDFLAWDPHLYETVLDGGNTGSVISVTNSGFVFLHHLTLTNGDGAGNCFPTVGCGGGIYAEFADLHIGHCYIHHNVANPSGQGSGGGIYAAESTVEIWGSRIVDNIANGDPATSSTGNGGGITVIGPSLSLRESEILDNVANARWTGYGGGIYLSGLTSGEILSNTISGNKGNPHGSPTGSYGGGMYVSVSSSLYVAGNLIENNYNTSGQGAGISSNWSDIHLDRNRIISNTSSSGAGVYIRHNTPVTLSNNLIANNKSLFCCGGVYVTTSPPPNNATVLVNNTIVYNGDHAIGTWNEVELELTNNLIAFHDVGINAQQPASATVTADHNLFWNTSDPIVGTNAVQADPQLNTRYDLQEGSPALNAGVDVAWVTTDLEGNPRPPGEYDLGAFEGIRGYVFLPLTLRNH